MICGIDANGKVDVKSKGNLLNEAILDEACSSALELIKNWMISNGGNGVRNDENFILQFLTICDFNVARTKERIVRYMDIRRANPNWFQRPDESLARSIFCEKMVCYSTNFMDDSDISVCVLKLGNADFDKYTLDQFNNVGVIAAENAFVDFRYQLVGPEIILDFANFSLRTASIVQPTFIWKMINLWQGAMPVKVKKIHIVNAPTILNNFMLLSTCFMSQHLKKKILNHKSDLKSLHAAISPQYLPFEYGGTAGSAQMFANESMEVFKKNA